MSKKTPDFPGKGLGYRGGIVESPLVAEIRAFWTALDFLGPCKLRVARAGWSGFPASWAGGAWAQPRDRGSSILFNLFNLPILRSARVTGREPDSAGQAAAGAVYF